MNKLETIEPVYVKHIPEKMENGKIYISIRFGMANHLCACGCGVQTVTPLNENGWTLTDNNGIISLSPSIGNWSSKNNQPYHAHYWIKENKIIWC